MSGLVPRRFGVLVVFDHHGAQSLEVALLEGVDDLAVVVGDDRQSPMLDVLFSAFFERGRGLRRIDELVALAGEVDLDPPEARTALETGRYASAIRADRELAAAYGVGKIPTYVVEGPPPIHGAKRPAVFLEALRKAGNAQP